MNNVPVFEAIKLNDQRSRSKFCPLPRRFATYLFSSRWRYISVTLSSPSKARRNADLSIHPGVTLKVFLHFQPQGILKWKKGNIMFHHFYNNKYLQSANFQ